MEKTIAQILEEANVLYANKVKEYNKAMSELEATYTNRQKIMIDRVYLLRDEMFGLKAITRSQDKTK